MLCPDVTLCRDGSQIAMQPCVSDADGAKAVCVRAILLVHLVCSDSTTALTPQVLVVVDDMDSSSPCTVINTVSELCSICILALALV